MNDLTDVMLKDSYQSIIPYLRVPAGRPGWFYYGEGASGNWSTQCTAKCFAAMAVMAKDNPEAGRTAHGLFRYLINTHLSGTTFCENNLRWGNTWISALSLERVLFATDCIKELLTDEDKALLRKVLLSESDFLLNYPIEAAIPGDSGMNKPESNLWNGGILLRTALDYPDAPNAGAYRERALKFFANGICTPLDNDPLQVGSNFTETLGLNHHNYLNVGYMAICLSHVAITHFMCKDRGVAAPEGLYKNAEKLWQLLKTCTFPDGRMCRIGGDTRIRYCYCQLYLPMIALWAEDYLGDADAPAIRQKAIELLRKDQLASSNGSFFGARLGHLEHDSYQYYCRLESDAFAMLAFMSYYQNKVKTPASKSVPMLTEWFDDYHGAGFLRNKHCIRSWSARSPYGVMALCVPLDSSDMAEWLGNLTGDIYSVNPILSTPAVEKITRCSQESFTGYAESLTTAAARAEGEQENIFARRRHAVAALPDGRSMVILEYSDAIREVTLDQLTAIALKMPNDIFNNKTRIYKNERIEYRAIPVEQDKTTDLQSSRVCVDDKLSLMMIYGGNTLQVKQSAKPNVIICRHPYLTSLTADVIGSFKKLRRVRSGEVLIDSACAVSASGSDYAAKIQCRKLDLPGLCRGVEVTLPDNRTFRVTVNFGTDEAENLPAQSVKLEEIKK